MITFTAQITKVVSKTTASMDKEYQVTIVTDDPTALNAGLLSSETTVKVTLE